MERREALRLLATAAVLPLPGRLPRLLLEARAEVGPSPALRTLDPHQAATVTTLAEILLPRTETPGATDAGVREFIDLIVTEWYDDDERARFLAGLASLDSRSRAAFQTAFVDSTPVQQIEVLSELDLALTREVAALKFKTGDGRLPTKNFFYMMKQLTLTGYYTSQVGAEQELHFQMFPGRFDGCAPAIGGKGWEP